MFLHKQKQKEDNDVKNKYIRFWNFFNIIPDILKEYITILLLYILEVIINKIYTSSNLNPEILKTKLIHEWANLFIKETYKIIIASSINNINDYIENHRIITKSTFDKTRLDFIINIFGPIA